jgi:L-asparagine oxygenase
MQIKLTDTELQELRYLASLLTVNPVEHPSRHCKQSKNLSTMIPRRIYSLLHDFANNGSKTGFLLFSNLNFDEFIPETPDNNNMNIGINTILSRVQSILLSSMAELISYEAECNGVLFQDIVPMKEMERIQTSTSSMTELEIHTEQAFSLLKPDILSLACLRGCDEAMTYILTVDSIFQCVSLDELEKLLKPLWLIEVDQSFKQKDGSNNFLNGNVRGPMSILRGTIMDPTLVFDQDLIKGLTKEATELIEKIVKIYYNHRTAYSLQTGDIMFIDNNRAVHGRSSFSPLYNGNDRFLIRAFGTKNLKCSEYARTNTLNDRMVLSIYS